MRRGDARVNVHHLGRVMPRTGELRRNKVGVLYRHVEVRPIEIAVAQTESQPQP